MTSPGLGNRKHRVHNRAHWQALRLPCARCGHAIDYDGPRILPNGKHNPRYLVVGHIVSRMDALALGWTLERINDLSNTQPECWTCSVTSGARDMHKRRRVPLAIAAPEASHW